MDDWKGDDFPTAEDWKEKEEFFPTVKDWKRFLKWLQAQKCPKCGCVQKGLRKFEQMEVELFFINCIKCGNRWELNMLFHFP